jgi:hypothetical protein
MSRTAFTVIFADETRKDYSRNIDTPEDGDPIHAIREFVATRPYVRTPQAIVLDGAIYALTGKAPSKPAKTAVKPAKEPRKASAPASAPAPVRTTQTRKERKASREAAKIADAKSPALSAHERRMAESPAYALAYTEARKVTGHVTASIRAYNAMVRDFEQGAKKATRKSRKAA